MIMIADLIGIDRKWQELPLGHSGCIPQDKSVCLHKSQGLVIECLSCIVRGFFTMIYLPMSPLAASGACSNNRCKCCSDILISRLDSSLWWIASSFHPLQRWLFQMSVDVQHVCVHINWKNWFLNVKVDATRFVEFMGYLVLGKEQRTFIAREAGTAKTIFDGGQDFVCSRVIVRGSVKGNILRPRLCQKSHPSSFTHWATQLDT